MENKNFKNEIKRLVDNIETLQYVNKKHINFLERIYSIVHSKIKHSVKIDELMKEIDYIAKRNKINLTRQERRYYALKKENRCVICGNKAKKKREGGYYTFCEKHYNERR